jgi:hypothetical protein
MSKSRRETYINAMAAAIASADIKNPTSAQNDFARAAYDALAYLGGVRSAGTKEVCESCGAESPFSCDVDGAPDCTFSGCPVSRDERGLRDPAALAGALDFYAAAENWKTRPAGYVLASAAEIDAGATARRALARFSFLSDPPPPPCFDPIPLGAQERAVLVEMLGRVFGARVLKLLDKAAPVAQVWSPINAK